MFALKRKDEVLNHWVGFAEGFNIAPQEFFNALEQELTDRKIPGLFIYREDHAEGGLLSDKRIYLRLIRERLAFDTCAAPFGKSFFFSCRTVYSPAVVRLWHIAVLLLLFSLLERLLWRPLGPIYGSLATCGLVIAVAQIFRNTVALGLSDLDSTLLKIPAIGPVYERWFRPDTYYRQDTRLMYLETIPKLVLELAEEVTADKGVKLTAQYQRAPILGELYKRVPPSREEPVLS